MTRDERSAAGADPAPPVRSFGVQPLRQTREAAAVLRRLAGLLISLEHEHPAVDEMIDRLGAWETELAPLAPPDPRPRFGPERTADQRVYLDHAFDVGSFNPSFPEYEFIELGGDTARGTVTFPVLYEGPPGLVHGGMLAAFFDCVIQHHNCVAGVAGKTRSLTVTYRRPTPLLTPLEFDITRQVADRRVLSTVRVCLDGQLLCTGELDAVAEPAGLLAERNVGERRAVHP